MPIACRHRRLKVLRENTPRRQTARADFSAQAETRPRNPLSTRQTANLVQEFLYGGLAGPPVRSRESNDDKKNRDSLDPQVREVMGCGGSVLIIRPEGIGSIFDVDESH